MIDKIKNNKIIIILVVLGIILTIVGILIKVLDKKPLPPFVNATYFATGGSEGYCTFGDDYKYVCQQDDGEYINKYSYDPKTKIITYYNHENEPYLQEEVLYVDEETYDFIYKYDPSYGVSKKEAVGIRYSEIDVNYSNFGDEIKDISNINLFEKYEPKTNGNTIQIDKEKQEFTFGKYSGTFKIYKMKTNELPNYILFTYKISNYEKKEGYFIKEDGKLYEDENLNTPVYVKSN